MQWPTRPLPMQATFLHREAQPLWTLRSMEASRLLAAAAPID